MLQAAQRGYLEIIKYLLSRPNIDLEKTDDEGYNALDIAITYAQYSSAILLKRAGLEPKSADFYKKRREIFTVKQVNVENFLQNLHQDNDTLEGKLMQNRDEVTFRKKFKDPVVDPNETFKEMVVRMVDMKKPKLVLVFESQCFDL